VSRNRLTLVVLTFASAAACKEVTVELDPRHKDLSELCAGMSCAELPRCADGGGACLACSCCPCTEGEALCDPDHWNVLWRCQGGCYIDEPCTPGTSCQTAAEGAICEAGTIDCGRVDPYDLLLVCGRTEELCAQCGDCLDCDSVGQSQICDDFRPSGSAQNLLVCDGVTTCMQLQPCPTSEHCLFGMETGLTACSGSVTCRDVGCTGYPICGEPASVCGDCGCCDVSATRPADTCGSMLDGSGSARYIFNGVSSCYDAVPCSDQEICAFDSYDRPICVTY
jgi:hypothetical protein